MSTHPKCWDIHHTYIVWLTRGTTKDKPCLEDDMTLSLSCTVKNDYFNPSLVTIHVVAAQCLPYGKQRMGTQVQPTLTLLVS